MPPLLPLPGICSGPSSARHAYYSLLRYTARLEAAVCPTSQKETGTWSPRTWIATHPGRLASSEHGKRAKLHTVKGFLGQWSQTPRLVWVKVASKPREETWHPAPEDKGLPGSVLAFHSHRYQTLRRSRKTDKRSCAVFICSHALAPSPHLHLFPSHHHLDLISPWAGFTMPTSKSVARP